MPRKPSNLDLYRADGKDEDKWERHLETRLRSYGIEFESQFNWVEHDRLAGLNYPKTPAGRPRRWTADFAILSARILIECDGAVWSGGGHTFGGGYTEDRRRDNEALCNGWKTVRVTSGQVESDEAIGWIVRLLGVK
jgi:very-short-patch-repair endonuclease